MKLANVNAVVTGASQGLGARIAQKLIEEGASVLLCARGAGALEDTAATLKARAGAGQVVATMTCDVANEADVDALLAEALRVFPHVDALVNNAGVYGPLGPIESVDWQAWKDAVAINLFGTVYPCRAFTPHFKERGRGKIVCLSGGGATNPLPNVSSYAAAKAGVVRFAETLAHELKAHKVDVNSIAPGVLATRMTQELLDSGPDVVGENMFARVSKLAEDGETSFQKASDLCAYLCSSESDGVTGRLLSALWDPWPTLHERAEELDKSDIYTIRRIVPEDRNKDWSGS